MNYLFVIAHPDDELLGAGGFIHKKAKEGHDIAVAVFNTCDTTRYTDNRDKIKDDMKETHQFLGVKTTYKFSYVDSNFQRSNHREMVQDIEDCIRDFQPNVMFTQHPGDVNTDHYWMAASAMEAFHLWQRGREKIQPIRSLYLMEVQSSTDWALNPVLDSFKPNTYVELAEEDIMAKIDALGMYENVIRDHPHPRSPEALAALPLLRGAQCGCKFAEAFQCVFRCGEDGV